MKVTYLTCVDLSEANLREAVAHWLQGLGHDCKASDVSFYRSDSEQTKAEARIESNEPPKPVPPL